MIVFFIFGFIFCFLTAAFFAASEISFISSGRIALHHRKEKKEKGAAKAYRYLRHPDNFLATVLVGVNLSNVLSTSLLTFILIKAGIENSNIWITFLFTPLAVIFADLVPKNIGRFYKEDFSCKVAGLIGFFEILFYPLAKTALAANSFLKKIFLKNKQQNSFFVTKKEIRLLARQIEQEGQIDLGERKAIEEVLEFKENKVKDFCLPLAKVAGFDYADSKSGLISKMNKYRFTRYPVYQNKKIIGYVNAYDLFYNPAKNWRQLIRPITKIGWNQRSYQVFSLLQKKRESIALVIKGNKAYGVVFVEGLIRQILASIVKI